MQSRAKNKHFFPFYWFYIGSFSLFLPNKHSFVSEFPISSVDISLARDFPTNTGHDSSDINGAIGLDVRPLKDLVDQTFEGICYRMLSPGGEITRPPPKFITGAKPADFDAWFFGDHWMPEAGLYNVTNLHLLSDRILVRDNKILLLPENGIHEESVRNVITSGFGRGQQVLRIDEEVVLLCGPAYQMYGHWLVDFLPRLFCLVKAGYNLPALRYLLPIDIAMFAKQWLSALGVNDSQIIFYDTTTQQCAISRAMIPTNLRGHSLANPLLAEAFQYLKSVIQTANAPFADRKIFISRARWGNMTRQLLNTEEMEGFFAENGFEIVYPEELSIHDQIMMFSQSAVIAGEYGTGLHGSVFAPASTKIIALRCNHAHPSFLQSGLCNVSGQDCGYIFGETSMIDGNQHFKIKVSDAAKYLAKEVV